MDQEQEQANHMLAIWQAIEHRERVQRTEYAIKLRHPIDQWAGTRRMWVDYPCDAIRFPTMTRATIAAIEVLELAPDAFTVEAV